MTRKLHAWGNVKGNFMPVDISRLEKAYKLTKILSVRTFVYLTFHGKVRVNME